MYVREGKQNKLEKNVTNILKHIKKLHCNKKRFKILYKDDN